MNRIRELYITAGALAEVTAIPRYRRDGREFINWRRRLEIFLAMTRGWIPATTFTEPRWPGMLWGLRKPHMGRYGSFDLVNTVRFDGEQVWDHVAVFRDPNVKRRTSAIFSAPFGHVDIDACLRSDDARAFRDEFHVKFVTDLGFAYGLDARPFLVVADEERGPPDPDRWRDLEPH